MKNHAVVFESQAPRELRIRGRFVLIDLPVRENLSDLLVESIRVRHVPLVELEVHLQSLVGDPRQSAQVESLRLVALDFHDALSACTTRTQVTSRNETSRRRRDSLDET